MFVVCVDFRSRCGDYWWSMRYNRSMIMEYIECISHRMFGLVLIVSGVWDRSSHRLVLPTLWLANLNIDSGPRPRWILGNLQCIMGSRDEWEFLLFLEATEPFYSILRQVIYQAWEFSFLKGFQVFCMWQNTWNPVKTDIYLQKFWPILIFQLISNLVTLMPDLPVVRVVTCARKPWKIIFDWSYVDPNMSNNVMSQVQCWFELQL